MPTYEFDVRNVRDGSTDVKAGQALTIEWECVTDDELLDAGDVIAALDSILGIGKGSPHPTYGYALCTNVAAVVYEQDPFRWNVKATFLEPKPQPGDPPNPSGGQPSPPDRQAYIRGNFRREDVFRGVDNSPTIVYSAGPPEIKAVQPRPFVNTAGDLFDNPPPIPLGVGQFVVTRFFDVLDYSALRAYQNACNAAPWQGFPKHSLCILGIEWEPYSERGWFGAKVTFTVEHRPVTPEQQHINPANKSGTTPEQGVGPFIGPLQDLVAGAITGGFHPIPVLDVGWYCNRLTAAPQAGPPPVPAVYATHLIYDEPPASGVAKTVPGFLNGVDGQRADGVHYLGFDIHPRISFAILG